MKKALVLLVLILSIVKVYADEGRYRTNFKSKNNLYELRIIDTKYGKAKNTDGSEFEIVTETTWGLFDSINKVPLYSVKGNFTSKLVFVSDDGIYITIIDDESEDEPEGKLKVLQFYASGNLQISYSLEDLLCSLNNVSQSMSHFTWCYNFNFSHESKSFTLITYELRIIVFDILTGKIISNYVDPVINKNTFLVSGEVNKVRRNYYEIEVCHRTYGKIPKSGKVRFKSKSDIKGTQTLLIKNGRTIKTQYRIYFWPPMPCNYNDEITGKIRAKENDCL